MTDDKKETALTYKQRAFTKTYIANEGNVTQATLDAGYKAKNRVNAEKIGYNLIRKPKIQNEITALMADKHPQMTEKLFARMEGFIDDPNTKPEVIIKMIELLAKIKGWFQPTKHQSLNVNLKERFKLPSDGTEE